MANNEWKKWEKEMAKWVIQYLSPWQKENQDKDWVTELYNQKGEGEEGKKDTSGGLHPPPPPPIP